MGIFKRSASTKSKLAMKASQSSAALSTSGYSEKSATFEKFKSLLPKSNSMVSLFSSSTSSSTIRNKTSPALTEATLVASPRKESAIRRMSILLSRPRSGTSPYANTRIADSDSTFFCAGHTESLLPATPTGMGFIDEDGTPLAMPSQISLLEYRRESGASGNSNGSSETICTGASCKTIVDAAFKRESKTLMEVRALSELLEQSDAVEGQETSAIKWIVDDRGALKVCNTARHSRYDSLDRAFNSISTSDLTLDFSPQLITAVQNDGNATIKGTATLRASACRARSPTIVHQPTFNDQAQWLQRIRETPKEELPYVIPGLNFVPSDSCVDPVKEMEDWIKIKMKELATCSK